MSLHLSVAFVKVFFSERSQRNSKCRGNRKICGKSVDVSAK